MISDEQLSKALDYLSETDEPAAKAKALLVGLEEQRKTVKAVAFQHAEGTMAEKENAAYASQEYRDHVEKVKDATYDFELYRNRRQRAVLVVEVWRSHNANRRSGNV